MKKLIFCSFISLFIISSACHGQGFGWVKTFKNTMQSSKHCVDQDGNVYTTGYFTGSFDADPNSGIEMINSSGTDIYILKTDTSGNLLWAKNYGGLSNTDAVTSIAIDDSANLYVTGYFSKTIDFTIHGNPISLSSQGAFDAFVAKIDSSGNTIWAHGIGEAGHPGAGADDLGYDITIDPAGTVLIMGYYWNIIDFDPSVGISNEGTLGRQSAFILKLSKSGELIWVKTITSKGNIYGLFIGVDERSNIIITTVHTDSADLDPGIGTNYIYSNGSIYVITKLDIQGEFIWAKPLAAYCDALCVSGHDVYFSENGGISHLDTQGNIDWTKTIGPHMKIKSDRKGDLYAFGSFKGSYDFDPGIGVFSMTSNDSSDLFIQKMDHSGNFIWAKQIGARASAPSRLDFSDLVVDNQQNIYASGVFTGRPNFNPGPDSFYVSTGNNLSERFLLKLDSTQNLLSTKEALFQDKNAVYPNPTKGKIYFQTDAISGNMQAKIFSSTGQLVLACELDNQSQKSVDLSRLPSGIYWVVLQQDTATISRMKIVKD